jgi:signal transduction histidine kinase
VREPMMKQIRHKLAKLRSGRTGITRKLFFVTAVMFILFISAELLFQFLFIGKFYYAAKEKSSAKGLDEFCRNYEQNTWGKSVLDSESAYMADRYDMQLVILDDYGNNKYGGIEMAVRNADGREICVDLHDVSFVDTLSSGGMEVGKTIRIKGLFSEEGFRLRPFEIEVERAEWKRNGGEERTNDGNTVDWERMVQVDGTIEYLRLMNENEYESDGTFSLALKASLRQWQEVNIRIPDKRCIQDYRDTATGSRYKVFIFPVTAQNGSREAVFAIVPLQPVDEAVEVIKNYLAYIFLAAFAFVLILSYIYSRMVTQPLIKMNAAALRMSRMDFSVKCGIRSRDELGDLAESLNTMASKLDSTITELKEFVSNASHELKTPISAMEGYLEALRDNIRKDKRGRYLERLQSEVDKMRLLVQDMLELSRMEAGSAVLSKESFDLRGLLNEILQEFMNRIREKNIRITDKTGQKPAFIYADRTKTGHVIENFITNAIRHTSDNGEIWINAERKENETVFTVENQGEPIPEEKIGRIWERFYRVEPSRIRNSGGTGLGLAIAAEILRLHNAQYGARNTERGVLFYFIINDGDAWH